MGNVLIIDDDTAICRMLELHMDDLGYPCRIANSAEDGLLIIEDFSPQVMILDIRMQGMSGLEALPLFKQKSPDTQIIMITAYHDMESTVEAIRLGADEYIHKPVDLDELTDALNKALNKFTNSSAGVMDIPFDLMDSLSKRTLVGSSKAMSSIYKTIGRIADTSASVLITGESGTGKELIAQAIKESSKLKDGPFVAINCAALVETLLESDLFGHKKGSFTGAVSNQMGKFEIANNGTIFLDEIGELKQSAQAKLLRVLQEKEFVPVGGSTPIQTSARIIAATNRDLSEMVAQGQFREDLYYRLQVVSIHLPPLRERKEDLVELVRTLLSRANYDLNRSVTKISKDVLKIFQEYNWPGNVRELANVLIKAVALCNGDTITPDLLSLEKPNTSTSNNNADVSFEAGQSKPDLSSESLDDVERQHVTHVLTHTNWHKGKTCEILGVSRPRLQRLIQQYNLAK